MREIDALPPMPRRILRLASVLGRSFDQRLLEQLLQVESVETVEGPLTSLRTQLLADSDGTLVRFRHAVLQEAAYQSLPFRQRLALHRTVGETIERDAAASAEAAPMLSHHFLEAQDWGRAWLYARKAALSAQQAHAPGEVAVHLERAVVAARRLGNVAPDDLVGVYSDLGHTREMLGEYERADDAYRLAGVAAGSDQVEQRTDRVSARLSPQRVSRPSLDRHPAAPRRQGGASGRRARVRRPACAAAGRGS